MTSVKILRLLLGALVLAGCAADDEPRRHVAPPQAIDLTPLPPVDPPAGCDMILWEAQNWESGGGWERLTLWADGRSEWRVQPERYLARETLRVKPGWTEDGEELVRTNPIPPEDAKARFRAALAAGIHLLEPTVADYVDGDGTRVGVSINGELKAISIAGYSDPAGEPSRRHMAVRKALGFALDFPWDAGNSVAYDVAPPKRE